MNPVDVGNQTPINRSCAKAAEDREDWLHRCWGCSKKDTVDRNDTLGLCPDCIDDFQYPGYEEAA